MQPDEIQKKLGLTDEGLKKRNYYVQPSIATTGEGLFEGLQWLTQFKI